jgi:alkylhydroperoxidase/carboxymuconolactone decarboxylase family protein YurZ
VEASHLPRIAAAAATGQRDLCRRWCREALDEGVPVRDLQEAALQVFLFAGYPRGIDALEDVREAAGAPPPPPVHAPDDAAAEGRALFARIYGPHTETVLAKLEALHPDLARFVVRDAYGQVLGRPFLGIVDRELLAVAMLAALGLRAQLRAHVHGALRVGATPAQVRAAVAEVVGDEARGRVERALGSFGE